MYTLQTHFWSYKGGMCRMYFPALVSWRYQQSWFLNQWCKRYVVICWVWADKKKARARCHICFVPSHLIDMPGIYNEMWLTFHAFAEHSNKTRTCYLVRNWSKSTGTSYLNCALHLACQAHILHFILDAEVFCVGLFEIFNRAPGVFSWQATVIAWQNINHAYGK